MFALVLVSRQPNSTWKFEEGVERGRRYAKERKPSLHGFVLRKSNNSLHSSTDWLYWKAESSIVEGTRANTSEISEVIPKATEGEEVGTVGMLGTFSQ